MRAPLEGGGWGTSAWGSALIGVKSGDLGSLAHSSLMNLKPKSWPLASMVQLVAVPFCTLKDCGFNSWSGHISGLQF